MICPPKKEEMLKLEEDNLDLNVDSTTEFKFGQCI